jgi:hypothetical protein
MPSTRAKTSGGIHTPRRGGEDATRDTHPDRPVAFTVTRTSPFGQACAAIADTAASLISSCLITRY